MGRCDKGGDGRKCSVSLGTRLWLSPCYRRKTRSYLSLWRKFIEISCVENSPWKVNAKNNFWTFLASGGRRFTGRLEWGSVNHCVMHQHGQWDDDLWVITANMIQANLSQCSERFPFTELHGFVFSIPARYSGGGMLKLRGWFQK
jgi:hypothetical protein